MMLNKQWKGIYLCMHSLTHSLTHSLLYTHIPCTHSAHTNTHPTKLFTHTHIHTPPHYTANTTIVFAPSCHPQHTHTQYTHSLSTLWMPTATTHNPRQPQHVTCLYSAHQNLYSTVHTLTHVHIHLYTPSLATHSLFHQITRT